MHACFCFLFYIILAETAFHTKRSYFWGTRQQKHKLLFDWLADWRDEGFRFILLIYSLVVSILSFPVIWLLLSPIDHHFCRLALAEKWLFNQSWFCTCLCAVLCISLAITNLVFVCAMKKSVYTASGYSTARLLRLSLKLYCFYSICSFF